MISLDRNPILPAFSRLALVGLAVDAPFIAFALIAGNVKAAISLAAGWGLAAAVYGMLHFIVGRGLDFFTPEKPATGSQAGNMTSIAGFAAAMIGKYLVIGALLYAIWRTGYLAVLPFLGGFVLAQVGIIVFTVRHMKKPIA